MLFLRVSPCSFVCYSLPVPPSSAVLVTGTSTGIGHDIALQLAEMGFYVFATVRKPEDGERLKKESKCSERIEIVLLDVVKPEMIAAAFKQVKTSLKDRRLYGVINNSGITLPGVLEYLSDATLKYQYEGI